jgi:serine/threonine protein kinase
MSEMGVEPGNIMLTKSGAKLLDFGLAKPAATIVMSSRTGSLTPSTRACAGRGFQLIGIRTYS